MLLLETCAMVILFLFILAGFTSIIALAALFLLEWFLNKYDK